MENLTSITFRTKIFDYETEKEWKYLGTKPCVIDCFAHWCGPCRAMDPILDELDKQYGNEIDFYKVNTENESELSSLFGIKSIPTFLFIPVGGKPHMTNGSMPKTAFVKIINEVLNVN